MGTSTTTGDGGMTAEERESSKTLVYQLLPSRYGMNPDDLRKADAIEVVIGQGAKPGGGGMLLGQKISDRVAENIMSGTVIVEGNASQSAGATGRGGLVVVNGDASARCGISMKGVDIVVRGSVGHMSAFMAQKGCLVVCGDAGDALGDSIYEAHLYVRGSVKGLGADCVEKELREHHVAELRALLERAGVDDADPSEFRRYGSARRLYNFNVDNAGEY